MTTKQLVNKVLITNPSTGGIWPAVAFLLVCAIAITAEGVAYQQGKPRN